MPLTLNQFLGMVLAGLTILGIFGLPVLFILRQVRGRKIPVQATPRFAYDGRIVLTGLLLYILLPDLLDPIWQQLGLYHNLLARHQHEPELFKTWRLLLSRLFAFPFQLGVLLYAERMAAQQRSSWWKQPLLNYARGYLTWLVAAPLVFLIHMLANFLTGLLGAETQKHPLTTLADDPTFLEWCLLALQAVIVAPILEEVAFRGLLFSWTVANRPKHDSSPLALPPPFRPWLLLMLSVGLCFMFRSEELSLAIQSEEVPSILRELIPMGVALLIIPLGLTYPQNRWLIFKKRQDWLTVLATASLFGFLHVKVWPTPIPLFVLGLFLGYVRLRTNSLVAPIVAHALFNSVSLLYLLMGGKP
ncbi:MAG: CPBP family intramembrane metalloprotease [Gemmataceae bacterium]|nr:CPBP family intramembrane metalloprotease [Gemmataceae bacterium]